MSLFRTGRPSGFHIEPIYDDPSEHRRSRLLRLSEGFNDDIPVLDSFKEHWGQATGKSRCKTRRMSTKTAVWLLVMSLCVAFLLLM